MVIIQQIDLHEEAGMTPYEAVVEASLVRFRPIMLAALTTILGLVPMFASPFWNAWPLPWPAALRELRPSPCSFCRRFTAQSIGLNPLEAKSLRFDVAREPLALKKDRYEARGSCRIVR